MINLDDFDAIRRIMVMQNLNYNLPMVTIIIPSHNYGHLIAESIESAMNQTYGNIEIIVVDDESTDNTKEVVSKYPRVNYYYIKHKGKHTPAHAQNFAISKAKGEFITLLGADDVLNPEYVKTCYAQYLISGEKTGLIWSGGQEFGLSHYFRMPRIQKSLTRYSLFINPSGVLGNMFVPKKVYNEVGFFNENISGVEDWEMAIRILLKGYKAVGIYESLVYVRIHKGNFNMQRIQLKATEELKNKFPLMHIYHILFCSADNFRIILQIKLSMKEKISMLKGLVMSIIELIKGMLNDIFRPKSLNSSLALC